MTHDEIRSKELKSDDAIALFDKATSDGYQFKNTATWGAFKKGWSTCQNGKSKNLCPYVEPPGVCTFIRGYRRFWLLGYDYRLWKVRPDLWTKPIQQMSRGRIPKKKDQKASFFSKKIHRPGQ